MATKTFLGDYNDERKASIAFGHSACENVISTMTENEDYQAQQLSQGGRADGQREATELQTRLAPDIEQRRNSEQAEERGPPTTSDPLSGVARLKFVVIRFWAHQVLLTVSHDDCRDHFALERTYLGYLRTSLAFAQLGVIISQLFRLENEQSPGPKSALFDLGIPMAGVFIGIATVIALLGAFRFWKQQNAIARKKVYAGGWELTVIALFTCGVWISARSFYRKTLNIIQADQTVDQVSLALFILVVAVETTR